MSDASARAILASVFGACEAGIKCVQMLRAVPCGDEAGAADDFGVGAQRALEAVMDYLRQRGGVAGQGWVPSLA